MSTQQQIPKPSLTGVRIKARKGAVKASAKHEPQVFRDQLYRHLETVQPGDFEGYANKLILAGSQLEFSKYSDALFEILLAGGLLQPGGTYLEEQNAPPAPFSIVNASDPVEVEEMKKYVEVFNKLLRRYKYLQKPLEEASLPSLLQYAHRWTPSHRNKLSFLIGLLLSQSLISSSPLVTLTKDHLVKDYLSISLVTLVFKAYLSDLGQGVESLGATLKKGGVKELTEFLPVNKRTATELEGWFKKEGLPEVGDWYKRKRLERIRKTLLNAIKEHVEKGEDNDSIISWLKESQSENPIPDTDLIGFVWTGLMGSVDWAGAKPEQVEALAVRKVTEWAEVFEAFTSGPKTEVALIGAVQVYCYEENRIMKSFPQILKVLYNKDCVSDQAILYWHSKGSKPQGRQHFLNATQPLVNFLREQEDSDEDED